jgi:PTK7 protein tyrosine kinase 7
METRVVLPVVPLIPSPGLFSRAVLSHQVALCSQVALGMEHLSNNRFVHKDLAARNCLISAQRQVKVSALGLSKDVYNR